MKYKKKPLVIEAVQLKDFKLRTIKEVLEFMGQSVANDFITQEKFYDYCHYVKSNGGMTISTLEGEMFASLGDYIIKGVHGEFYPCKPDIFDETYDLVSE